MDVHVSMWKRKDPGSVGLIYRFLWWVSLFTPPSVVKTSDPVIQTAGMDTAAFQTFRGGIRIGFREKEQNTFVS